MAFVAAAQAEGCSVQDAGGCMRSSEHGKLAGKQVT
jgi:hypothetical protein